jgi:hypothetical protein
VYLNVAIPELTLTLNEYETNDAKAGDFLCVSAEITCRGFAGHTTFWLSRAHLEDFLAQLQELDRVLQGAAELVCGWGTDENIRLSLSPFGHSGRLLAQVRLADSGPSEGVWNHVQTEFVLLPNALTEFRSGVAKFLEHSEGAQTRLVGEPEAAV